MKITINTINPPSVTGSCNVKSGGAEQIDRTSNSATGRNRNTIPVSIQMFLGTRTSMMQRPTTAMRCLAGIQDGGYNSGLVRKHLFF